MFVAVPPRYPAPEWFGLRSEEEKMSTIALSHKAAKLMKLCDLEGYKRLHDLLRASTTDSLCPAICMTEGCDYTTEMERDQDAGYCEACGADSALNALMSSISRALGRITGSMSHQFAETPPWPSGYAASLKSPTCASRARLKAGRAVQRSI